EVLYALFLSR
ncbi:putative membrane protein, partial [Vibrio parahaemolyticus VPTS-2010_2]